MTVVEVVDNSSNNSVRTGSRDFLKGARKELDGYYKEMQTFDPMSPDKIFKRLANMSCRASYIRGLLMRKNYGDAANNFRTREIDPFLAECDRQYKVWSRYISVLGLEWDISSRS